MKKFVKQRTVLPIYLMALPWLIGCLLFGVHSPAGYLLLAVLSIVIFGVGKAIWRDRVIEVTVPDPESAPVSEPEPEPEDPELAALSRERDRAVSEMRRLNDNIADPVISSQIDHIETVTRKIFELVLEKPQKKSQIRRFLNYYLPTTIKLLNTYDRMDNLGVSGVNIDQSKEKIRSMLSTIVTAFDRQLDALFAGEAMDISAEITVLENMMAQEGLK